MEVHMVQPGESKPGSEYLEIFAQHLAPTPTVIAQKGLGPSDYPHHIKRLIHHEEKSLMLVGNLPHLSRLATLLILVNPERIVRNIG
jgi:phosphohistidine phosphatase SixA